jgi:hypothetical protein
MRVKSLVLALMLACGLAAAAGKPTKAHKHAVKTPKAAKHSGQEHKGVVHKTPKVARHKVSTPKIAKRKTAKFKKHKA